MAEVKARLTVEVDEELFRRIKAEAALRGESLRQYVQRALDEALQDTDRGPIDG